MKTRREEIATVYATQNSVSVDEAMSFIFDTRHSMRLTWDGYEYYKAVVVPTRIELVGVLTNRHSLYLHRYMAEPFIILHKAKPILFVFEEKMAAYLLLAGNDFDRFVKSKMASLPK